MLTACENQGAEKSWKMNGKNMKCQAGVLSKMAQLQHSVAFIPKTSHIQYIKSRVFGVQTLKDEGDTFY
jgi:hypothetical protein